MLVPLCWRTASHSWYASAERPIFWLILSISSPCCASALVPATSAVVAPTAAVPAAARPAAATLPIPPATLPIPDAMLWPPFSPAFSPAEPSLSRARPGCPRSTVRFAHMLSRVRFRSPFYSPLISASRRFRSSPVSNVSISSFFWFSSGPRSSSSRMLFGKFRFFFASFVLVQFAILS